MDYWFTSRKTVSPEKHLQYVVNESKKMLEPTNEEDHHHGGGDTMQQVSKKTRAASGAERNAKYRDRKRGKFEPDEEKAALMNAAFLENHRKEKAKYYQKLKDKRERDRKDQQLKDQDEEILSLKERMREQEERTKERQYNGTGNEEHDGGPGCGEFRPVTKIVELTSNQAMYMRQWLIENMQFTVETVNDYTDSMLQMKHSLYWYSLEGFLKYPGVTREKALILLRARALVEAGDMGGGDGWKAMEDIVKNNVRWFIYNKTNLLKQVISGTINLSAIESFDKCNLNREANVQGFQMQRSAVGQTKLDIANAMREEYTLPVPKDVVAQVDSGTLEKICIMNVRNLVRDYFRIPAIREKFGQKLNGNQKLDTSFEMKTWLVLFGDGASLFKTSKGSVHIMLRIINATIMDKLLGFEFMERERGKEDGGEFAQWQNTDIVHEVAWANCEESPLVHYILGKAAMEFLNEIYEQGFWYDDVDDVSFAVGAAVTNDLKCIGDWTATGGSSASAIQHCCVNEISICYKGKGRGLLCDLCYRDFTDGNMETWKFDVDGNPYSYKVTDFRSIDCECNCYGVCGQEITEPLVALEADAPELKWYFDKPSTATSTNGLKNIIIKASQLCPTPPTMEGKTDGQLLGIFEALYLENHASPQDLKAMLEPSTEDNKLKIRWGLRMRSIADEEIPMLYKRGLDAGWFKNIPSGLVPLSEQTPDEVTEQTIVFWEKARLTLIYVINYGLQIRFARQHLVDQRLPYRLIKYLRMISMDTMHGIGRIHERLLTETQQSVIALKPPTEKGTQQVNTRFANMNVFSEAIVFDKNPRLNFDDRTGAPIWELDANGEQLNMDLRLTKSQVQVERGHVKPFKMPFHLTDKFFEKRRHEDPMITRYMCVGLSEYLHHWDPIVKSKAVTYFNKSKAVHFAWIDLFSELKRKSRPLMTDQVSRLRPLIMKFSQLYREKEGSYRISNYIWYIMSMALVEQMQQFPVHALCNQSCENKIGLSRRYIEHNTQRNGYCGVSRKRQSIEPYVKNETHTYSLGKAVSDRLLVQHAINIDRLNDDDEMKFLESRHKIGKDARNMHRREAYADRTPFEKRQDYQRRKQKRMEAKERTDNLSFRKVAKLSQEAACPQNHFILARPKQKLYK